MSEGTPTQKPEGKEKREELYKKARFLHDSLAEVNAGLTDEFLTAVLNGEADKEDIFPTAVGLVVDLRSYSEDILRRLKALESQRPYLFKGGPDGA